MAHQSLYRRYRSRDFSEIRGQAHVVNALRNAVRNGTEGHAYLFSGPRGTGKTSTARILAKALNCTDLRDGEPCRECDSCLAMEAGSSYDLFELDAASNSGVDAMRELIGRSIVASPGRTKVYILDEVHMLTAPASNALLKTLEEPPDHVKFVLATTDPHKVLPTIRSRTQHFDFTLLSADELTGLVRYVVDDAGLDVDETAIAYVVREGRGSARDTLSALDRVVAAGGIIERDDSAGSVLSAIAGSDVGAALTAVSDALTAGRDPRVLGEATLALLRNAFLLALGSGADQLTDADRDELSGYADAIGAPRLTRALEAVGAALVEMRQAPDPRIPLEVALIRLCDPGTDLTLASLAERVERLERSGTGGAAGASAPASAPGAGASARAQLGRARPSADDSEAPPLRSKAPEPALSAPPQPAGTVPGDAAEIEVAQLDVDRIDVARLAAVLPAAVARLKGIAKAIYGRGRFVSVDGNAATFALENAPTLARAERVRTEVEAALSAEIGQPVTLVLIEESAATTPAPAASPTTPAAGPDLREPVADTTIGGEADRPSDVEVDADESTIVLADLVPADVATTGADKLSEFFPGATVVEDAT